MITRYTLITLLLNEYGFDESARHYLSKQSDETLLSNTGYKQIRKGYYKL